MPGCRAPLPRTLAGSPSAPWGTWLLAEASPPRAPCGTRGPGGDRVAIALPPGEAFAARCTAACCSARWRSARPAAAGAERAVRAAAARASSTARSTATRTCRPAAERTTSTRPRRRPHLGTTRRARRHADLRQLALERARLGGGARPRSGGALALLPAAVATWAGSRSCCARRSTAPARSCTSASTPMPCSPRSATGGATLVSLVPATLTRLLDAGLRAPAARCAGHCSAAPRSRRGCSSARRRGRPRRPDLRDDRGVLADPHERARPLFCTQPSTRPRREILVRGPTVSPEAGPGAAHRRPRRGATPAASSSSAARTT